MRYRRRVNAKWHERHPLPKGATTEERVAWHREHQERCGCRPVPASLAAAVAAGKKRSKRAAPKKASPAESGRRMPGAKATRSRPGAAAPRAARAAAGTKAAPARATASAAGADAIDPRFAPVVAAFADDPEVTYGGKGFGATALKVGGKIFAMSSASGRGGELVVKLPKPRVDELVARREGERFDPGHGRVMKEWLAAPADTPRAVELAREARRFVAGDRK